MLACSRSLSCRVSVQNYKTNITAETRKAIAGLDGNIFGFNRAECCGPVPEKLPGSFQVTEHVILNTALPPTEWAKRTQNVPLYKALEQKLKDTQPSANLAVCHTKHYPPNSVFRFQLDATNRGCSQYYTIERETLTELPWAAAGASARDVTSHYFIFICSHKSRDARCGYCGPVLVDVLSQEMQSAFPGTPSKVHVIPCSHFGGHVYAGNVLVYSKHGGICFGCVTPSDAEALVQFIRQDNGVVPEALMSRVRGRMTTNAAGEPEAKKKE